MLRASLSEASGYGSAKAPPFVDKFRRARAQKSDVDRDSTFYNYYLNIVGGYYMDIICVLTEIRGLYSE